MHKKDIVIRGATLDMPIEAIKQKLSIDDDELAEAILKAGIECSKPAFRKNKNKDTMNELLIYQNEPYGLNFGYSGINLHISGFFREIISSLDPNSLFRESVDKAEILFNVVVAFFKNVKLVKDYQKCVYYQAVKWQKDHGYDSTFKLEDILPDRDCPYREYLLSEYKDWICEFYHDEYCDAIACQYKVILDSLCNGILEKTSDDGYKFIF